MRATIRILGLTVLDLEISEGVPDWEAGTPSDSGATSSYPIGFTPTHPIQLEGTPDRWGDDE